MPKIKVNSKKQELLTAAADAAFLTEFIRAHVLIMGGRTDEGTEILETLVEEDTPRFNEVLDGLAGSCLAIQAGDDESDDEEMDDEEEDGDEEEQEDTPDDEEVEVSAQVAKVLGFTVE